MNGSDSVLNTHQQYDSGFSGTKYKPRIETNISDHAKEQMRQMRQTDPSRVKYLSKLATSGFITLGGRSTKKMNKNKKKYKLRRRYSKKNRKSMKRK
jgi:hypothetical protein